MLPQGRTGKRANAFGSDSVHVQVQLAQAGPVRSRAERAQPLVPEVVLGEVEQPQRSEIRGCCESGDAIGPQVRAVQVQCFQPPEVCDREGVTSPGEVGYFETQVCKAGREG